MNAPVSPAITPGLMVIHSNHPEALRDLVVAWMRRYPLAPLESETILVQSNGIAQWLKLSLAQPVAQGGCGVTAAVDVQLPAQFLWRAYRAVLGKHQVPEISPLDKQPLTWRLMHLLPQLLQQNTFAALRRFLQDDGDQRKRYQLAERIADLLFSLNRDFATTLILVTHDETLAARCQRRLRLREGKLWEEA